MKLKIILIIFLFLEWISVSAANLSELKMSTGLNLLHSCEALIVAEDNYQSDRRFTDDQIILGSACSSFILGVVEGVRAAYKSIYEMNYGDITKIKNIKQKMFCTTDIPIEEAALIVVNELKNHPAELNWSAGSAVNLALVRAFPCK